MEQKHEKIVERVRKLLALARSSNVHEAEAAAEQVNKLMLEHRLSLADVGTPIIVESHVVDSRLMSGWRWGLFTACARSYYCDCVRIEEKTVFGTLRITGVIFGVKDEIDAVKCLYEYLAQKIDEMAEEARKQRFPTSIQRSVITQVYEDQSWRLGATGAISEKLEKSRIMFERENPEAERRAHKTWEAIREYQKSNFSDAQRPSMAGGVNVSAFKQGFNVVDKSLTAPEKSRGRLG